MIPIYSIGRKRRRGILPPALTSFREPPDTGGSFSFYPPYSHRYFPTGFSNAACYNGKNRNDREGDKL